MSDRRFEPRTVARLLLPAAALLCLLAGCGGGPGVRDGGGGPAGRLWPADPLDGPSAGRQGCPTDGTATLAGGTFTVAVTDSVRPANAPFPRNRSERLVFAQLYETLVRVDCDGNLQPGLATLWSCAPDSSQWIFQLRADAYLWDGTPVTADVVRRAWCSAQDRLAEAECVTPWRWLNARSETVTALDTRRLEITLPEPQGSFPYLLAHPSTAVAIRREGWVWPVGSGWARLGPDASYPLPDLVCRPNRHHPNAPRWESLVFRILPGRDPRDLADRADLLLVEALADVDYFQARADFRAESLPWTRLYLLACPPREDGNNASGWLAGTSSSGLAAVMTKVAWLRWPHPVLQSGADGSCPQVLGPVSDRSNASLGWGLAGLGLNAGALAYPAGDPGAREIAEHIVARASFPCRAVGLPPAPLSFVLQWRMAGAILLAVDQEFPTGCLELAGLLGRASWLQETARHPGPEFPDDSLMGAEAAAAGRPDPAAALLASDLLRPLGVSRSWLVIKEGLAGVRAGFDGVPLLDGLARAEVLQP